MSKSKVSRTGKKIGRPSTGATSLHLRILPDQYAAVGVWISKQKDREITRPEAVRQLIDLGLKAKGKM